jgi:hypothetical protein
MSFLNTVRESENTPYPDGVDTFGYVRSRGIYAGRDETNQPVSLLIGASKSIELECREDLNVKLGNDSQLLLYDISDNNFLKIGRSNTNDAVISAASKLILSTDTGENTVQVGDVQLSTVGTGVDSVTSIRSILGGTLRLGGDVSFEKATLSKSESNILDGDFFSRSLQIWKNVLPTNMNAQTGEMEYVANDPDMVGFQFVISDNNRLELNKYTRFVTSVGEQRTHVTKLAAAFGVQELTHNLASTSDNDHYLRTFGTSSDIPVGIDGGTGGGTGGDSGLGLWNKALQDNGVWIDKKVGIGLDDPLYNLHVIGDVSVGDKIYTNLPIETTSYIKAQTLLTESDARVKEDVVSIDPEVSERVISQLRPCTYTQLTGDKKRIDGFIAQEVYATVPTAVTVKPSVEHGIADFHYLEAMPLISHLVATVQRLGDRIALLEANT